jgi:hypothetical protein
MNNTVLRSSQCTAAWVWNEAEEQEGGVCTTAEPNGVDLRRREGGTVLPSEHSAVHV